MAARSLSLQDHFLNSVRRAKLPVTIFLVKGVKLQGVVTWFDAFSLLLRREGTAQLVYKHSISTIMPAETLPDFVPTTSAGEGAKASLQDQFLAAAARDKERMTLFLVNGVMLQGTVTGFDQFSLVLERGGQIQLVYKHAHLNAPAGACAEPRRGRTDEGGGGGRVLKGFDGNGAIEVARGERAVIVVPELPREGARRSAEARVEEAEGLAASDRHRRRGGAAVSRTHGSSGNLARQGPGRGDSRDGQGEGRRAADRRCGVDSDPAEEPRRRGGDQGNRPHRADPGDLRRARGDCGRAAPGRTCASRLPGGPARAQLDPPRAPARRLRLSWWTRRNADRG